MSNETEKLTINLSVVDLAQIDAHVEQGLYANRSDFIRTVVRKELETRRVELEQRFTPVTNKNNWRFTIGINNISQKTLEGLARENKKLSITVIGMLIVDRNISAELFGKTVESVVILGKLVASDEIKEFIERMNE